jgi:hypothetical protein
MFAARITCSALAGFSFLISYDCFSQSGIIPKWEAGINVGAYLYQGDLTPRRIGSIETIQPGIGIFGTRIINKSFSARLMFNMARLVANEAIYQYPEWRKERAFASTTSVKELTVSLHWNVFGSNYDEVKYEPYVFAGAGASYVNVSRNYSSTNLAYFGETSRVQTGLAADIATPTPRLIPVAPVGAGVRYHISDRIVLNLEGSYRLMHTDYLDGFSQSANPNLKDHYSSITIGAAYKFGSKEKYGCPSVN